MSVNENLSYINNLEQFYSTTGIQEENINNLVNLNINNIDELYNIRLNLLKKEEILNEPCPKEDFIDEEHQLLYDTIKNCKLKLKSEFENFNETLDKKEILQKHYNTIKNGIIEVSATLKNIYNTYTKTSLNIANLADISFNFENNEIVTDSNVENPSTLLNVISENIDKYENSLLVDIAKQIDDYDDRIQISKQKIRKYLTIFGIQKLGSHLCPICLTNEVNMFFSPCGHTICKKCIKANYCHICRTKISDIHNIYFN